jgi:mono/diheme cytochrome c family protein
MKQGIFLSILTPVAFLWGCSSSEKTSSGEPTLSARASEEGKYMMNPVRATPASLGSGRKLYEKLCMECHGEKGDGVNGPNLIDDQWDHGSTDGDIFVFIRDGSVGSAAMKGLNGRPGVGATEMWNLVNYVRSLKR